MIAVLLTAATRAMRVLIAAARRRVPFAFSVNSEPTVGIAGNGGERRTLAQREPAPQRPLGASSRCADLAQVRVERRLQVVSAGRSASALPGAALKLGATDAVATAFAPCAVTETGSVFGTVFVSLEFELNATSAYSAPVAPPRDRFRVPASPGHYFAGRGRRRSAGRAGRDTVDVPAVSAKTVTSEVPEMLAETETVPGDAPRVTWVLA